MALHNSNPCCSRVSCTCILMKVRRVDVGDRNEDLRKLLHLCSEVVELSQSSEEDTSLPALLSRPSHYPEQNWESVRREKSAQRGSNPVHVRFLELTTRTGQRSWGRECQRLWQRVVGHRITRPQRNAGDIHKPRALLLHPSGSPSEFLAINPSSPVRGRWVMVQMIPSLWWFNLMVFWLCDGAEAFCIQSKLNFRLWVLIVSWISNVVWREHSQPQLSLSPVITKVNSQYAYNHSVPMRSFRFPLSVQY